jgi:prepilin-type N-terminal cleavage/methylation domain-containing protein
MKHERAGFTLIELLVVIAIIGILVASVRPSVTAAHDRANIALCESREAQIQVAMRQYVEDHGQMPATLDELVRARYLLNEETLHCSKTGLPFAYHRVSPDGDRHTVIVSCVAPNTPRGKRPHSQGTAYVALSLSGKTAIAR